MATHFCRITYPLHVHRYDLLPDTSAEGLSPKVLQFFYDSVQSVTIDCAQT